MNVGAGRVVSLWMGFYLPTEYSTRLLWTQMSPAPGPVSSPRVSLETENVFTPPKASSPAQTLSFNLVSIRRERPCSGMLSVGLERGLRGGGRDIMGSALPPLFSAEFQLAPVVRRSSPSGWLHSQHYLQVGTLSVSGRVHLDGTASDPGLSEITTRNKI